MKKFYIMLAALGVTASMAAQQLPNAGFDTDWADCIPWTSDGNTKVATQKIGEETVTAQNPSNWTISHVIGMGGTGATVVGSKVDGKESSSAVRIFNSANPFMSTQKVPGYLTLGTTWSTAKAVLSLGIKVQDMDGGTFGGIEFDKRPDAVSFDYKRAHGTVNATEQATIVAYSWKGTYTQANVPGNIKLNSNPTVTTMTDRDRNILNMDTPTGGEKSATPDAKCISKINYALTGDAAEWTNKTIDFEYLEAEKPEKFNIIFAAGDYWSTSPGDGNELIVDNVKLVYYSRLSGLQFKDADVPGFDPDKFDYNLDEVMPDDDTAIKATTLGNSGVAEAAIELDRQNSLAKITVTNAHGNDADDQNSHVYTVKFLPAGSSINDVIDMTTADVRYIDLYGNAVAADALVNGQTYIKLVNGKATKVIANN